MAEKTTQQKKKVDAKEFSAALQRLSEDEKFMIFYMLKGIELATKDKQSA